MCVVNLVRFLERTDIGRKEKAEQIKLARDNGEITPYEALEIVLDYFSDPFEE